MELAAIIARVKHALTSRRYSSEADVREAIVLPVLRALGWDDLDPERVRREYPLGARRVDYALSAFGERPALFIEVKGPGALSGVERQLFEDAFHAGIQFAVLTNGQEWSFFLPAAPGSYEERLLYKRDLIERETGEISERLMRYLGFERVRSGDALKDANRDFEGLHKERIVRDALPPAWRQILEDPDELLVELVVERTTSLAGYPAPRELVLEFLSAIEGASGHPLASGTPLPRALPVAGRPEDRSAARAGRAEPKRQSGALAVTAGPAAHRSEPAPAASLPASRSGPLRYRFEGQELTARSANDILVHVARTLAGRQPAFLERFAAEARGRSRNHVARRREGVYPGQPHLIERVIELVPGWYIGTNVSNVQKMRLLESACRVAGLRFGVDLVVDLSTAQS